MVAGTASNVGGSTLRMVMTCVERASQRADEGCHELTLGREVVGKQNVSKVHHG